MQAVKTLIRKVGPTRSTVLITGESGTGKELVARALHAAGPDPEEVFLAVNCAAIPHDLLENQLFGHVRGAFTGADRDHAGLFVAAGRGTVFLDEIGELSRSTQAKLLRAIENKEVLPVGRHAPGLVPGPAVDGDEQGPRRRGRRRSVPRRPVLPPQRGHDPPACPCATAARISPNWSRPSWPSTAGRLGKRVDGVDNATIRGLMAAPWTGNVRELDNALERAVILSENAILTPDDFPPGLIVDSDPDGSGDNLRSALSDYERQHIQRVLRDCNDDKRETARRLGLGLSSLYRKLEELGIRLS